jgi:hypothetical protein
MDNADLATWLRQKQREMSHCRHIIEPIAEKGSPHICCSGAATSATTNAGLRGERIRRQQ